MEGNPTSLIEGFSMEGRLVVGLIEPSKGMCDTDFLGSIPMEDYKWRSHLDEERRKNSVQTRRKCFYISIPVLRYDSTLLMLSTFFISC